MKDPKSWAYAEKFRKIEASSRTLKNVQKVKRKKPDRLYVSKILRFEIFIARSGR